MKYTLENGKCVTIPDKDIENYMKSLEISRDLAIDLWLEDNDYQVNEELEELDKKAKKVKIDHGASGTDKTVKKDKKPKVVKVSDEKQVLFNEIWTDLYDVFRENAQIVKENKLISVQIGEKIFKIDIIEQRQPKK